MNSFLWAVLMYFESYLEHDKAKSDENIYTPGYDDSDSRPLDYRVSLLMSYLL